MRLLMLILLAIGSIADQRQKRQTATNGAGFWWENLNLNSSKPQQPPVPIPGTVPVQQPPVPIPGTVPVPNGADASEKIDVANPPGFGSTGSSSGPNTNFSADLFARDVECGGIGSACVPYYLCKDGFIVTDGIGLIDIRVGSTNIQRNSKCLRFLEVCCSKPEKGPVVAPQIEITKECGQRNIEGVHANIPGFNVTQTQFAEYPWMVALLRVESIGSKDINLYICGGSLIYPNIVLTAAHCVKPYDVQQFKVRAGEWDTQSDYELYPHQDRIVSKVIVHPNFHPQSLANDYGILVLESPFVLAPNINTVCLPNPDEHFNDITCFATGWGKDKYGVEGQYQNILKQVPLGVVDAPLCEDLLRNTRLGKYYKLHETFICAGGEKGIDTCKGDGGSPLVCARPKPGSKSLTYFQVGIVAWGIGCGENGVPGVYADVTEGVDWIYSVVGPLKKA